MKKILGFIVIFLIGISLLFLGINEKNRSSHLISNVENDNTVQAAGASSRAPRISIWGNNKYNSGGVLPMSTTDEAFVDIDVYNVNGTAKIKLYRADEDMLLDFLLHDENNNQLDAKVNLNDLKSIVNIDKKITSNGTNRINFPDGLEGIFILNFKIGEIEKNAFIVRSDFGVVAKEAENEIVFWAQDFKSKKSVSGATIDVYNLFEKREILFSSKFDKQGIAKTPISSQADIGIIKRGEDVAFILINLNYLNTNYNRAASFDAQQAETKYFLFTDRPIYKPGESVFFKSIIRDDRDSEYDIADGDVTVKIYNGWNEDKNVIFNEKYKILSDGTIDGEYSIPEDLSTGTYRMKVSRVNDQNNRNSWFWSENSNVVIFQIEYFQKPEYSLSIDVPYEDYISGDQLTFNVGASYFSGQRISQKEVSYTVYSSDYYDYSYYYEDLNDLDSYRYGYWRSRKISEGKAMLGSDGNAVIDIGRTSIDKSRSQVYTIEATFQDESNIPVFARKNILIRKGEFNIYKKRGSSEYHNAVGDETKLDIILVSHRKSNISKIDLDVKINRSSWEYDAKSGRYKNIKQSLPDQRITTDDDGEVEFKFTPELKGSYRINVSGKDSRGNLVSKRFYLWVHDGSGYYYNFSSTGGLSVKADREEYKPGEDVHLSIYSEIADCDVFLSVERGWSKDFQVIHLDGQFGTAQIDLDNSYVPNIFISASSFTSNELQTSNTGMLKVSPEGKKINIDIIPDKEKYGPGDYVNLNVRTTDYYGDPISSDITVWAVDKAIYELRDSNLRDAFDAFYKTRYNSTASSHSLRQLTVYGAEMGCFPAGTKVLMLDGKQKNIEDVKEGDYVMTFNSENKYDLRGGKVIGLHNINSFGYLIINDNLKVTPNHKLWINKRWDVAGNIQIGDLLLNVDGKEVAVESIQWQLGKEKVYNLEIENYHTYFANGIWVHNDKGGDGSVRSVFESTAYWNPRLRTGANGVGKVTFKLPDNLTTWVIAGVASTSDTKIGQNLKDIVVSKDIILRPILPNILRNGDAIILSAIVQNFTDNDYDFNVSLEFDSGKVFEKEKKISIRSNDFEQIFWNVYPEEVNDDAELFFSAVVLSDPDLSDKIIEKIPVRQFGFWEKKAVYDSKDKNVYLIPEEKDSQIEESSVDISISSTLIGSLPDAMKYLIRYPYGCIEQTTSCFVPVVIANKNPELFKDAIENKSTDKMIKTGIKKLSAHQGKDGGWSWWYSDKSDPFLSAYVFEYILKAKDLDIEFNENIIEKARLFFENSKFAENSDEYIYKMYALSLLSSDDDRKEIREFGSRQVEVVATAVMANIENGYLNPKTNGLDLLLSMKIETKNNTIYWEAGTKERYGSFDSSTALALRAIVAGKVDHQIAVKTVKYLIGNKKANRWANTYATARVVQALVDYSKTTNELNPNYKYNIVLGDEIYFKGEMDNSVQSKTLSIPMKDVIQNGQKIEVLQNGNGQMYVSVITNCFFAKKDSLAKDNGMSITREYINTKGERLPIEVGDVVEIRLQIYDLTKERYAVIEDHLPSGLVPMNVNLKNEGQRIRNYYYYGSSGQEFTENGIVYYINNPYTLQTRYSYKARAISAGVFNVPPAETQMMYSPEINGRTNSQTISIGDQTDDIYLKKPQDSQIVDPKKVDKRNIIMSYLSLMFIYLVVLVIIIIFTLKLLHHKKD